MNKGSLATLIALGALTAPLYAERKGHHKFINNSDMRIHVSVLYHACDLDSARIHYKGEVDKTGKPLSNEWTAHGGACCVKRIDIRDADANKFLKSTGGKDLRIDISNASARKAAAAGSLGLTETDALFKQTMQDKDANQELKTWIECLDNSEWVFSGSRGTYLLTGPHGKTLYVSRQ